jgi:antitoxin Phd
MIIVTDEEAQARLEELLDTVQCEPIFITKHGRVAAVLVAPQEMQDLPGANFKQVSLVEAVEAHFARGDGAKNK